MKLSEIDYSNNFNDLDIDLKNYINTDNHVVFLDSNLSSILNLDENLNIFEIDINESTKGLETIQKLWSIMFDQSLDRNSKVIGIGGGVLSDLVGFATSTFKRGAKLCLIPSTLLGMVDAAHGGKNGFNNDYGKNQIGTFFIPEKILICSEFLDSLSENELNNGIIESTAGIAIAIWFSFPPHVAPVARPAQVATAAPPRYGTGIGQRLSVTMPDGSTATLNTNTRLQVAYDAHARRLVLERGQAVFHVAKGQPLPFEVVAGGRTITAHGTVFDVRLDRDAVAVALFEGKVSVSGGPGGRENALLPNQMLTASAAGTRVTPIRSTEQLTSWQNGMIVFDDEPLSVAVAEINRYVRRPLVIGDAGLSSLRISGAFQSGDTKAFVEAMQLYFPVQADEPDPSRILLKTKP